MTLDYSTCLKLKVLGLSQSHKTSSRYYITPDLVLAVQDLGLLTTIDGYDADWTPFVFIPKQEDIVDFLGSDLGEVRFMAGASSEERAWCAIARAALEGDVVPRRVFGVSMLEALAELAISVVGHVKEKDTPSVQA